MLEWQGTKPGTFVNNSTIEPIDANNLNAIVNTIDKIATGGKDSGLDADTIQGVTFEALATTSDENLTNFYSFDSIIGSASEFLLDESGLNLNGTSYNISPVKGIVGMAGSFNGSSSYASFSYTNKTSLTISCWYKGTATGDKPLVILKRANNAVKICLCLSSGYAQTKFLNSDSVLQTLTDTTLINDDVFHHITVTHSGTSCKLYVDGYLKQSVNQTLSSLYYNQGIVGASEEVTPTIFTQGIFDDVRVYNTALTQNQIYGIFFNKINSKSNLISSTNQANSHVFRDSNGDFSAHEITSDLVGNSSTATALETPRSISLTGDVSDVSANFDGSENISLTVTVEDDSHSHTVSTLTGVDDRFVNLESLKEYDSTYTYALNEPCFYLGVPYKSLSADNTNHNPVTDTLFWEVTGGGSSSSESGITFTNGQLERNVTDYNPYADTAGTTPVDGTGGTPTITFTFNSTSPLVGLGDAILTKPATNCQGQGVSHDFTIDRGKVQSTVQVSFEYQTGALYTDGDIGVFIYDITNATLIPVSIQNLPATNEQVGRYLGTFIPSSSSLYRLIWHIQSTNASTYTFEIDDIVVSQKQVAIGAAISNWTAYTPATQGFGTISGQECMYRRVGSSLECRIKFTVGTPTADEARIYFPSGITAVPDTLRKLAGEWIRNANLANTNKRGAVLVDGTKDYVVFSIPEYVTVQYADTAQAGNVISSTGNLFFASFSVPISQWTSNINLASDFTEYAYNTNTATGTDTTSFGYGLSGVLMPSQTWGSAQNKSIKWSKPVTSTDTKLLEVYNSITKEWGPNPFPYKEYWSAVNGTRVEVGMYLQALSTGIDQVVFAGFGYAGASPTSSSQAGEVNSSYTWTSLQLAGWKWRVRKVSNGNMAEVPSLVRAEYYNQSNSGVALGNYITKMEDTHNAVTTGVNWKFTAPINGVYLITIRFHSNGASTLYLNKNGVSYTSLIDYNSTQETISYSIRLVSGDYISFSFGNYLAVNVSDYVQITWLGK